MIQKVGATVGRRQPLASRRVTCPGTIPVRCVLVYMGSKSEYLANARECEGRAQEMPPVLRQTFVSLAAHWRKLASNAAEAADRRQIQETADRRKKEG
jgi:hypothetical protein